MEGGGQVAFSSKEPNTLRNSGIDRTLLSVHAISPAPPPYREDRWILQTAVQDATRIKQLQPPRRINANPPFLHKFTRNLIVPVRYTVYTLHYFCKISFQISTNIQICGSYHAQPTIHDSRDIFQIKPPEHSNAMVSDFKKR